MSGDGDKPAAAPTQAAAAPAPAVATGAGGEILRTTDLVKAYKGRRVVDHASIHVNQGEIVGLLGPNGAGKTTTFRMVVGMVTPDSGRVLLDGKDVTALPMYKRARIGLGYLAQQESVFKKMSARDNVACVLEARGMRRAQREQRTEELLADLRILAGTSPRAANACLATDDVAAAALSEWASASAALGAVARLQSDLDTARREIERLEAVVAEASPATVPFAAVCPDGDQRHDIQSDSAALAAARAEAAALADQLQAERECFEALRLDLVGRLETLTARGGCGPADLAARGRKRVGQRVAAECKRFLRRLGDRRRRTA